MRVIPVLPGTQECMGDIFTEGNVCPAVRQKGSVSECPPAFAVSQFLQLKIIQMPRWQSLDSVLPSPPTAATPVCQVLSVTILQRRAGLSSCNEVKLWTTRTRHGSCLILCKKKVADSWSPSIRTGGTGLAFEWRKQ